MTDLTVNGLRVIAEQRIPSEVERIASLVEDMICLLGTEITLNGRESEVDLALREAVANAVIHGNREDPSKYVTVTLARGDDGRVIAIVRDTGGGFDPSALPTPLVGDRLYSSGGRGVFLMRSLMKDVTFHDGGREVHLRIT